MVKRIHIGRCYIYEGRLVTVKSYKKTNPSIGRPGFVWLLHHDESSQLVSVRRFRQDATESHIH